MGKGFTAKLSRGAAAHVLSGELAMRARRVASAKPDAFKLTRLARVLWRDEEIAELDAGDDPLKPSVVLLADEHLTAPDREKVQARLDAWIAELIGERLKSLVELKSAEDIQGLAKGIAFRMVENFGALKREAVAEEMRQLDQPSRAQLRKYGVRFGAFNIFLPLLLKPAAAELTLTLWALRHGAAAGINPEQMPEPPRPGLTSVAGRRRRRRRHSTVRLVITHADRAPSGWIFSSGSPISSGRCSPCALPRSARCRRSGSSGEGGFIVTPEMMSVLGCSSEELGHVLRTLGFRSEKRPAPPKAPSQSRHKTGPADSGIGATTTDAAAPGTATSDAAIVSVPPAEAAPTASDASPSPAVEPVELTVAEGSVATSPEETEVAASASTEAASETPAQIEVTAASSTTEGQATAPSEPIANAETGETGAVAKPDIAAEPEMVEGWRPRRRDRGERGERRGNRGERGEQRQSERHGERQGERGEQRQGQRHGRNRNQRQGDRNQRPPEAGVIAATTADGTTPSTAVAGATPAPEAGAAATPPDARQQQHRGRDRGDNRGDRRDNNKNYNNKDKGDRGPPSEGRDRQGDQNRGPRRDDRRGDRRDDRRRDERPRGEFRSAPPRKGPDPDSPFAALSALKQQLEKQAKERN